ncbi:ankyrin repeat domain-containing protein [Evansella sp. LMS18]|jgi:ankyrin repeat protein|uniref:ankyrin repeat domain-containing protein n=1 Tax=Evansella sp. LMS18 TaxID=2924033 RepID=UPI0020D11363|nr:ankyrin repeat domain-containing protein [Evansella sp. LMS18]UTR12595.1 ankyrin repeat domain-containing protein [Evansella sp. LMS18]
MINEVFQAAQSGDAEKLKNILSVNRQLVNEENKDGLTPLGFAAHFGKKEAVQVLLDFGADINALSHSKVEYIPSNTALHAAIAGERDMDVIKLLLSNGAKTVIFDSNGHTPLHTAAYHADNPELIKLLIDHRALVNVKVAGGKTALELAEEQGNKQAAELLRVSDASA